MKRNPLKDQVAIVGVGSTGFRRNAEGRSRDSLVAEAAVAAIRDAGLGKNDIDGVVGTAPASHRVVSMLGLPRVTHYSNRPPALIFALADAVHAVFSGACETALVYHAMYRTPATSRSAAEDPFRALLGFAGEPQGPSLRFDPEDVGGSVGYTAWASRYLAEYCVGREALGRVAVNNRAGALDNPLAVMQKPLTMEEYLDGRMIRDPLCVYDMDVPVDGADAFVVTSTERARDLPHVPVTVHSMATGVIAKNAEDQNPGLDRHGQHVVIDELRAKSDFWLSDVDVYFPYDGFSFLTLAWIENAGWCKPGEAGDFLADHWDDARGRVLINGSVPINPHGGGLSEGGTQGSGHIREAVTQLRGAAGPRQVAEASTALLTPGGFFFNAQGLMLRSA